MHKNSVAFRKSICLALMHTILDKNNEILLAAWTVLIVTGDSGSKKALDVESEDCIQPEDPGAWQVLMKTQLVQLEVTVIFQKISIWGN